MPKVRREGNSKTVNDVAMSRRVQDILPFSWIMIVLNFPEAADECQDV